MVDWRSVDWWELPGPSRFLDKALAATVGTDHGVAGLALPQPRPRGLLDALARRIEEATSAVVVQADASAGLRGRSPTTLMAAAAGSRTTGLRSVTEFLDAPGLSGRVFLIDGIPAEDWYSWAYFLKMLRTERARRARMMAPSLIVVIPPGVAPDDSRAALGRDLRWSGQVSRHDTQTYMERLLGWPDDSLLARTAISVAVELAGWDPALARHFAGMGLEQLVDPRPALAALRDLPSPTDGIHPCWHNGLVDHWDGMVWVHTAALVAAGRHNEIAQRLWRGQVRIVFPFLERVREAYATKYDALLRTRLPLTKQYFNVSKTFVEPRELEIGDIFSIARDSLPDREARLLGNCSQMRRSMAHWEAADGWRIKRASDAWEEFGDVFPDGCAGWEWPRCGQKLVVLVGPSGAGKTTWANRNCDMADIVSSDAIRQEMFGTHDMAGDQAQVFARLRTEVVRRLSNGRSAVIDATNLRHEDRMANVRLAPPDVPVEYVVIDRPMADKVATAGWRANRPGLLETHAAHFERGLADVLVGDGLPNVRVVDVRRVADGSVNGHKPELESSVKA